LKTAVKNTVLEDKIFNAGKVDFTEIALEVFHFQYSNNAVYREFCTALNIEESSISSIEKIPYLPIAFFKTHNISTTAFSPEVIFESSGTTQTINSKHLVKDISLYQKSFNKAFQLFYGDVKDYCILGLLPSYLERNNSSLVMMVDHLIKQSGHPQSGFYLNNYQQLKITLEQLEQRRQPSLLIGVTFALLDFAEQFPMPLFYTSIMETGGMKGRKKEMTRQQVQAILQHAFQLQQIQSEYGMTELLSQAYSKGDGVFNSPPWMKILIREEDDPFAIHCNKNGDILSGAVNIIDLANLYSCSFLATDDAGKLYADGSFEILGRLDNSAIRGCSLLAL
jgi:hypothetical protein